MKVEVMGICNYGEAAGIQEATGVKMDDYSSAVSLENYLPACKYSVNHITL